MNKFLDRTGKEVEDEDKAYARCTDKSFYVKEYCGTLYTKDTIIQSSNKHQLKWRKVGPICFKNYLDYLKTNSQTRYILANRNTEE